MNIKCFLQFIRRRNLLDCDTTAVYLQNDVIIVIAGDGIITLRMDIITSNKNAKCAGAVKVTTNTRPTFVIQLRTETEIRVNRIKTDMISGQKLTG